MDVTLMILSVPGSLPGPWEEVWLSLPKTILANATQKNLDRTLACVLLSVPGALCHHMRKLVSPPWGWRSYEEGGPASPAVQLSLPTFELDAGPWAWVQVEAAAELLRKLTEGATSHCISHYGFKWFVMQQSITDTWLNLMCLLGSLT